MRNAYVFESLRDVTDIGRVLQYFRRHGFFRAGHAEEVVNFGQAPLLFRNDSGETCPAYACMEITGTVELDGINYVKITKPSALTKRYLFNGHIEVADGDCGKAQWGPTYRVYKNSGTVTLNNRWRPTVNQWYLTKGAGHYIVIGEDDVESNVFRILHDSSIRMYRFSLTESLSDGTASATIKELDGTTVETLVVNDPELIATALTSGNTGYCYLQDGQIYWIQAGCA